MLYISFMYTQLRVSLYPLQMFSVTVTSVLSVPFYIGSYGSYYNILLGNTAYREGNKDIASYIILYQWATIKYFYSTSS